MIILCLGVFKDGEVAASSTLSLLHVDSKKDGKRNHHSLVFPCSPMRSYGVVDVIVINVVVEIGIVS